MSYRSIYSFVDTDPYSLTPAVGTFSKLNAKPYKYRILVRYLD